MRTIEQIIKHAIGENPGSAVACTRDELLHGLNARQATHAAWTKLKGEVEGTADELVVRERNELLEALDAEIFAVAEAARRATKSLEAEEIKPAFGPVAAAVGELLDEGDDKGEA